MQLMIYAANNITTTTTHELASFAAATDQTSFEQKNIYQLLCCITSSWPWIELS
jgi:hypothetical protein